MADHREQDSRRNLMLTVYELYMDRYNAIFPRVPQDLRIYSTVNIAILGGLIFLVHDKLFGACGPSRVVYPAIVILGGIAVGLVAWLGCRAGKSSYDAWTRTITTLAKLESQLHLHTSQHDLSDVKKQQLVWPHEPIMFPLHLTRLQLPTSKSYVESAWNEGDYAWIIRTAFWLWFIVAILLVLFGVILLVLNLCNL